jgi:acetate kinase
LAFDSSRTNTEKRPASCHRTHKYLGAYAAVLGGVDVLVFGGGIGENAPVIRSRVCAGLAWLGLELDEEANATCIGTEQRISQASSSIDVCVIPVREEERSSGPCSRASSPWDAPPPREPT